MNFDMQTKDLFKIFIIAPTVQQLWGKLFEVFVFLFSVT